MPAKRKNNAPPSPEPPAMSPSTPFECPGLREDNPRDFLAALGLLRLLDMLFPTCGISLAWADSGSPIYQSASPLPDEWASELVTKLKVLNNSDPHPFVHYKVIKVPHEDFRSAIERALEFHANSSVWSSLPLAIYAAYGSQIHNLEKDEIEPTAFSFSNGQGGKELLRDIREMIENELAASTLLADLSGDPGSRRDAKSFRWHPAEFRAAAYRGADPGGNVKGDVIHDHVSANILAFFGLTFYPVADQSKTSKSTGMSEHRGNTSNEHYFTWPVWSNPLRSDPLASLLHLPTIHNPSHTARAAGCIRIWRSRRFSSDKSLYFSPASRVF